MFGFDDDFMGFMLTNDAHDDAEREEKEKALEEERKKLEQEKQEELYKSSALFPDDDDEDYGDDDEDSDYDDEDERDNGEMTIAEIRNLMTILGIRKNNPADEEEDDEEDDEDEDNENENQNEEEGDKYKYKALLLGFDYHCEEDYLKHIKKGDTFLLIPEPENPYDHNAIAAYKEGELRAYVMRADAKRLHNVVKEPTKCYVTLVSFNSVYVGFDV
jgi:hypothetical protein